MTLVDKREREVEIKEGMYLKTQSQLALITKITDKTINYRLQDMERIPVDENYYKINSILGMKVDAEEMEWPTYFDKYETLTTFKPVGIPEEEHKCKIDPREDRYLVLRERSKSSPYPTFYKAFPLYEELYIPDLVRKIYENFSKKA